MPRRVITFTDPKEFTEKLRESTKATFLSDEFKAEASLLEPALKKNYDDIKIEYFWKKGDAWQKFATAISVGIGELILDFKYQCKVFGIN